MAKLISDKDISSYIEAKGAGKPCDACGNPEWQFLAEPIRLHGAQNMLSGIVDRTLTTAALVCTNCGNMRFFPLGTIEAWLKDQGK